MMDRKTFVQISCAGLLTLGAKAYGINSIKTNNYKKLVILHTNDWHSRIEPFPDDNSRNANLGGATRRAKLIEEIRAKEDNILLLDAGDIFQGTPYFNFFGGELEFKLMSEMGYDAATMGNHDFDGGMDGFKKAMPNANFDFITTNYDFKNTELDGLTKKHLIFNKDGIKIGVFSANIELEGLVPSKLYKETQFFNPIEVSNAKAKELKEDLKCDYVICLSHLGYKYNNDKISDIVLAQNSKDIDLIIGGHTHTFMKKPDEIINTIGKSVMITQAGWAGILLGKIELYFDKHKRVFWSSGDFIK